ncbi:MAG: hypothetical protein IKP73_02735 [Bacteroidales bacterium]|nr:hypothetical protein [Bacteroidales bacterium]
MTRAICPYPGLRPFTEEESIFFKGRDLHIRQIVRLLEENKMAFITGASGDGKSSMVYAGVVPYIRAGFFKADYNSWIVADFKPQRNPLASIAESLSKGMSIDYNECIGELSNGFSAIVKLYQKHGFRAPDANSGKNLLIIADQFEEIFTNSDNFNDGEPSEESYTTINLLLETVRISVTEKLPVYVIFTMRSDFISQCTVFKSLPEFIAYSQFFVPQLKRSEICQVIEEPAQLAGGSVSDRLREVIVNNLNNGFDQLPVLQHALNLLWKTANDGKEQLDLIHLAKIAGISRDVLSREEQREFDRWFAMRPAYEKKYFEKPDLNNVLNAHAGILYESAYDYFVAHADWAEKNITPEDSKLIIAAAFKSLVKIDRNRPVRNRCTLNEIVGIINRPEISTAAVCGVLNIFRLPDNTLLRPFIETDNIETQYLSGDTVLDITHEALIRNWKKLEDWNAEEYADTKDFYDFNSQMQRWLENDRKIGFLLPAGNLGYFESWYSRVRPNPYWLAKQDASKLPLRQKLKNADVQTKNCKDFITESRVAVDLAQKAKKRKNRVIGALVIGSSIFLAGLAFWALSERNDAQGQRAVAEQKTEEARQQAENAEREKDRADAAARNAEAESRRAVSEAQKARQAQENALRAYESAEAARNLADRMKDTALQNLEIARQAVRAADSARRVAEEQTRLAAKASDSAARLYNIAVSNALALKAKNRYEDKTMNLRLAWSAWLINKQCAITENTPALYEAMVCAIQESGFDNSLKVNDNNLADLYIDPQNRLFTVSEWGEVAGYKIAGDKPQEFMRIEPSESSAPVQKTYFLGNNYLLYSTFDKKNYLTTISTQSTMPLKDNGYVNSAIMSDNNSQIIAAYDDGWIFVYDAQSPDKKVVNSIDLKKKILDISATKTPGVYYVLLHSGSLLKWNSNNDNVDEIFKRGPLLVGSKLVDIRDKHLLAVCYADGYIYYLDTDTDTKNYEFTDSHAKVEHAVYDPNTQILALSGSDKRITLLDTKDFSLQPYYIEENNLRSSRVKAIKFNDKGMLMALTDNNDILYWDTDIDQYAKTLETLNLQPLTPTEKNLVLGREFAGGL